MGKGDNFTPQIKNRQIIRLWSILEKLLHCYISKHNVQYHVHEEALQYDHKIIQTHLKNPDVSQLYIISISFSDLTLPQASGWL